MPKRINIILRETTIRTLNRLAKRGERSRLIDEAVQHYAATRSVEALRDRLKDASVHDRGLDREVTQEWFEADSEAWRNIEAQPERKAGGSAAKLPHETRFNN